MICAKRITIERAEGYVDECVRVTIEPGHGHGDLWDAANRILLLWSLTAPRERGYDKCDFRVEYEDGEVYEGRYDLHHWTRETDEGTPFPDLAEHMRNWLRHWVGKDESASWIVKHNPDLPGRCERMLGGYEIGTQKGGETDEACREVSAADVR